MYKSSSTSSSMVLSFFPLLFFTTVTAILISLQISNGMTTSNLPESNQEECLALLRLAGKYNLSTNCNCTLLTEHGGLWMSCKGSCTVHAKPPRNFVGCGPEGHYVRELHLSKLGLQGNMSWVTSFKHVKLLDVSLNNLSGSIPFSLWRLGDLIHVNLSSNSFSGHMSDFNDSVSSRLQTLDFSHNQITGHFPQHLCTSFPNITQLNINHNYLTGYANLSLCKQLESLDASFNRLQGSLFENLNANKSLQFIDLKGNNLLNGSIPSLSTFPQLTYFDVSYNNFSGMFCSDHTKLPSNLSRIDVSHNDLQVGLNASIISRIGLSSFWPNKACTGCFPLTMTPSASPSPSPSSPRRAHPVAHKQTPVSKAARLGKIIGITIGGIGTSIIIAIAACVMFRKRAQNVTWPPHHKRPAPPLKHAPELGPFSFESQAGPWIADVKDASIVAVVIFQKPLLNLTFADLIHATKSFDREFEVGDGTGLVYACILPGVLEDNAKVAIKVVEDGRSLSNEAARAAFTAMGEVKHDNLVSLLGYCIVGEEKLLIYKHMEGGSLEDVLHAVPEGAPLLGGTDAAYMEEDWYNMELGQEDYHASCVIDCTSKPCIDYKTRHNIALRVARALAYLHNGCQRPIVHGAVSSSCILLDVSANLAKLANYGGAWGLPRKLVQGYVAPECRQAAQMSPSQSSSFKCRDSVQVVVPYSSKCDVYAMGVILLELATGRRAVGNYGGASGTLVAWVRGLMKGKRAERGVDPKLLASSNLPQLLEMMKVGYLCTADSPSKRPSMQQVVGLLKDLGDEISTI